MSFSHLHPAANHPSKLQGHLLQKEETEEGGEFPMGWKEEEIGDFGGGVLATVCFFSAGFETLLGRKPPTTMSAQPDKGRDDQQGDTGTWRGTPGSLSCWISMSPVKKLRERESE